MLWLTGPLFTTVTDCVLVTVTLVNKVGAVAVQISETPRAVAARCTRVQVRPAPEIVRFWLFAAGAMGPSDAASATSNWPPLVVLKAAVHPRPVTLLTNGGGVGMPGHGDS